MDSNNFLNIFVSFKKSPNMDLPTPSLLPKYFEKHKNNHTVFIILFLHIPTFGISKVLKMLEKTCTENYEDPHKQILNFWIWDQYLPENMNVVLVVWSQYLPESTKWNFGNSGSIKSLVGKCLKIGKPGAPQLKVVFRRVQHNWCERSFWIQTGNRMVEYW